MESFKDQFLSQPSIPNEYAMLRKFLLTISVLFLASFPAHAQEAEEQTPAPASVPAEENILHLDLSTGGRVTIQLFPAMAPNHVERIKMLTRQGFYDGIIFHRVIEGFMAQTGDPTGYRYRRLRPARPESGIWQFPPRARGGLDGAGAKRRQRQ